MGQDAAAHLLRRNLSVRVRQPEYLVARCLDGSGLMDIDMGGIRAQYALVRPQGCGDHRQVGLGTAHQKVNVQAFVPAQPPD